jgi:ornithine cyclodeaminase/alanine dehydrogenase-like protein (mu-crystallin family)
LSRDLLVIAREEVAQHLSYAACIPLMQGAMVALSESRTRQLLRAIIDLDGGRAFGVMPGAMLDGTFGAKLISVFPKRGTGAPSHQGIITLFDPADGAPICILDAAEITGIRTASASAAATEVLARRNASVLGILGTGEQARRHAEAIAEVRPLQRVLIWGRSAEKADALASELRDKLSLDVRSVATPRAAAEADIVCTTTAASEPLLFGADIREGTHLNLVGSSRAGPVEVDNELVCRSRFFADHAEGVLSQGAEFIRAREKGFINDEHLLGEIGEVMNGSIPGRTSETEITAYKSLGSIVQDLASGWYLYEQARRLGFGATIRF